LHHLAAPADENLFRFERLVHPVAQTGLRFADSESLHAGGCDRGAIAARPQAQSAVTGRPGASHFPAKSGSSLFQWGQSLLLPSCSELTRSGPSLQVGRQIPLPAEPAPPRLHPQLGRLLPPRGSFRAQGRDRPPKQAGLNFRRARNSLKQRGCDPGFVRAVDAWTTSSAFALATRCHNRHRCRRVILEPTARCSMCLARPDPGRGGGDANFSFSPCTP